MDGDYYLNRLRHINQELFIIIGELAQDEYAKEQLFKLVPPEDRLVQFPCKKTIEENKKEDKAAFLKLNEKELSKMPKKLKELFKAEILKAHIRKRNDGRYEIRCQINGRSITASSKQIEIAKQKFIKRLITPNYTAKQTTRKNSITLDVYLKNWLDTVKKPYIKNNTYVFYSRTINTYIIPTFGNKKVSEIKQSDLQKFFNIYTEQGKYRTAKKIWQVLNPIFDYAVSDEIISRSPLEKVVIGTYEQQHGTALTRVEERDFIRSFMADSQNAYKQAFAFIIYTGLRRAELASVIIDESWVTVISAKQRKGRKEKSRRIPISPMLRKILPFIDIEKIKKLNKDCMTREFKKTVNGHHLHDLRHTFITRCQECGIPRELVSVWAGHMSDKSITATIYTHLEQNLSLQLKEIQHFIYDFK